MKAYPLLFEPILKPKVWGGRALAELGRRLPPELAIGESWELADLPESIEGGRSVIANGTLAGRTLRDVIDESPDTILGSAKPSDDGGFPLLIKYLDAAENLSVQVHPTRAYAEAHPEAHLKSEAWIVIRAEPGAVIYKGVKPGLTPERFADAIRADTVVEHLIAIPVEPGDCHYLPSGTCHALGAGIVVAEIQTPSDTTFRVYDWGRTSRELHVEQALQCIDFGDEAEAKPPAPLPYEQEGLRISRLVRTSHFEIERVEALEPTPYEVTTSELPEVWMVLSGAGVLVAQGTPELNLTPGNTVLLPAELAECKAHVEPTTTVLRVTLPSAIEGLIA